MSKNRRGEEMSPGIQFRDHIQGPKFNSGIASKGRNSIPGSHPSAAPSVFIPPPKLWFDSQNGSLIDSLYLWDFFLLWLPVQNSSIASTRRKIFCGFKKVADQMGYDDETPKRNNIAFRRAWWNLDEPPHTRKTTYRVPRFILGRYLDCRNRTKLFKARTQSDSAKV